MFTNRNFGIASNSLNQEKDLFTIKIDNGDDYTILERCFNAILSKNEQEGYFDLYVDIYREDKKLGLVWRKMQLNIINPKSTSFNSVKKEFVILCDIYRYDASSVSV